MRPFENEGGAVSGGWVAYSRRGNGTLGPLRRRRLWSIADNDTCLGYLRDNLRVLSRGGAGRRECRFGLEPLAGSAAACLASS